MLQLFAHPTDLWWRRAVAVGPFLAVLGIVRSEPVSVFALGYAYSQPDYWWMRGRPRAEGEIYHYVSSQHPLLPSEG